MQNPFFIALLTSSLAATTIMNETEFAFIQYFEKTKQELRLDIRVQPSLGELKVYGCRDKEN